MAIKGNKLSFKIGLLFFVFVFLLESVLFISLYFNLVQDHLDEEFEQLIARGNSHRDVLVNHFTAETMEHVAMMESVAETDVAITSQNGEVLYSSNDAAPIARKVMKLKPDVIPIKGLIVQSNWEKSDYIASIIPITLTGREEGYVVMVQPTAPLKRMVEDLKRHFMVSGLVFIVITIVSIFFLSRFITLPLIRMKEATERLSKGDFSVGLNVHGDDELAQLARSIERLSRDLDYLKRERNEFLASIAHELRTPLTYVKGYADLARRKNQDEAEQERYLNIIREEVDRLVKLVKDLFELAQLDTPSFVIEKERVDILTFLEKMEGKMRPALLARNIEFRIIGEEGMTISLDPVRMEQVFMNLLDNAMKHSSSGSSISLLVQKEQKQILFLLKDEGLGIPKKDLPHIFERMYRVDKSRSRTSGGSGLGLAIVKEIVEAHGGEIRAESILGQGTTIVMSLPGE